MKRLEARARRYLRKLEYFFDYMGELFFLGISVLRSIFKRPIYLNITLENFYWICVQSVPIIATTALFTGMVMGLQSAFVLSKYGAKNYIGIAIPLSMVRELGPVLTSLLVAGRVGSGITSEIGSMKVTEQIDAMRAIGIDPVKRIVTPKVIATLIALPVLTFISDLMGIVGGLIISVYEIRIGGIFYIEMAFSAMKLGDFFNGIAKSIFFAFVISLISCHQGMRAEGGTEGVGKATTATVVISSIIILVSDFFLTKLLRGVEEFWI